VEALSGLAMDDVRVHRNSADPARLGALAYTQGSDIHLGPGQERHLPHEAWHVVQQKQGRVEPTLRREGAAINHDPGLEREADRAGEMAGVVPPAQGAVRQAAEWRAGADVAQCKMIYSEEEAERDKQTLANLAAEDVTPEDLINITETNQIGVLAAALGQDPVPYRKNQPPQLAGEPVNYVIGHIYEPDDQAPFWGEFVGADVMAQDFATGDIKADSIVKLIGCGGGADNSFGPALARNLGQAGKTVTVIATTGVVHATGAGIASYPYKPAKGSATKTEVKKIEKSKEKLKKKVRDILEKIKDGGNRDELLVELREAGAQHFDYSVTIINMLSGQGKLDPLSTPTLEGWRAFRGTGEGQVTASIVTPAEAMAGIGKKASSSSSTSTSSSTSSYAGTGEAVVTVGPSSQASSSSSSASAMPLAAASLIPPLLPPHGQMEAMPGPGPEPLLQGGAPGAAGPAAQPSSSASSASSLPAADEILGTPEDLARLEAFLR
jgi:hypothetical protein